jgi:hypothetical protein
VKFLYNYGDWAAITQGDFGIQDNVYVKRIIHSNRAGIFKKSMGARHRLGIGLSYRTARLHRLAELMPWHRFLGSIKV